MTYYRCTSCRAILVGEITRCPLHPDAARTEIAEQPELALPEIDDREAYRDLIEIRWEDEGEDHDRDPFYGDRASPSWPP